MIIFSPGPSNISERVRKALLGPDINHRGPEFEELLVETLQLLSKACSGAQDYSAIVFTGSGTAAIEASLSSLSGIFEPLLLVSNGIYCERAYEIASLNGLHVHKLDFPINQKIDVDMVADAAGKIKPFATYFVHHETGTGILNPLRDLAKAVKQTGSLVMVDTISSIAGDELDLKGWGIDLAIGSASKCIRGTPGLSFVLASSEFLEVCSKNKTKGYYLNLIKHLEYERKGQTPFTPAVHTFYALREALRELVEEGPAERIKHYKKTAKLLRSGLIKLGLKLYLEEPLFSNTMTTVFLPEGLTFDYLYQQCRKKGYEIYNSIGELKHKTFRLGTVGLISEDNITGFLSAVQSILENKKLPVEIA
jgi:2-aminoethylphosphonate-pyruvate transaminase